MKYLKYLPVALLLIYAHNCRADNYGVYLEQLTLDYARFKDDTRDPILYPLVPKERIDLGVNLSFLKFGYLNNIVHSMTDKDQFRLIGWYYQLGVHIGRYADIYGEHFSQHMLDRTYPNYPVSNALGVKIYLYRR